MTKTWRAWITALSLALVFGFKSFGSQPNIDELLTANRLSIDAALSPDGLMVPGQKLTLTIKIATDTWFAGGTRIRIPEVSGLVILQTEQFANNASERRGSQSWVIQRWNLDVYPQRAGEFTLPPIIASVTINARPGETIEGELVSPPVNFSVSLPDSLQGLGSWVASPEFEVQQRMDRPLETLQVGDAFEREITLRASDVLAMMLPAFEPEKLTGLAAYPSPPVLDNTSNRGQTIASRTERISYIAESEGEYLLSAQDFFWWDTSRDELRVATLPAVKIRVGAGAFAGTDERQPTVRITPRQLLLAIGGLMSLALLGWLVRGIARRFPLDPFKARLALGWRKVADLRKPALPERLNPDSNAGG
ncbi:MAG: BatD family protein [Pseudomonadota bacterium]